MKTSLLSEARRLSGNADQMEPGIAELLRAAEYAESVEFGAD